MTPDRDVLLAAGFLLVPLLLGLWLVFLRRGRHELRARNLTRPAIDRRDWIEASFETMRDDGWDLAASRTWSFVFLDPDRSRLRAFSRELELLGYAEPHLERAGTDLFHTLQYRLTVTRLSCHSVESLLSECTSLDALAWDHGIQAFDGWEASQNGA